MEITERFVRDILKADYPREYERVYDSSPLLQYLDRKMKAVHGDSKTRRSLANIYAIYSILHYYQNDFFNSPDRYRDFEGYDYTRLFRFRRSLYGGSKLQNHALNSRPVTFVVKTRLSREQVSAELEEFIQARAGGMRVVVRRYREAIEEIITIHELRKWTDSLDDANIDGILRDMDVYYRLEMNMDAEDDYAGTITH